MCVDEGWWSCQCPVYGSTVRQFSVLPLVLLCGELAGSLQVLVDEFFLCAWQAGLVSAVFHGVLAFSLYKQKKRLCFYYHASVAVWMVMSVWSKLKYLNYYWMDCHKILHTHSWHPEDKKSNNFA